MSGYCLKQVIATLIQVSLGRLSEQYQIQNTQLDPCIFPSVLSRSFSDRTGRTVFYVRYLGGLATAFDQ